MPLPASGPILVAPSPTPFRDDDSVDFSAIEHNVGRWLDGPLSGFVLNSENGEEAFLSEAERLEIVRMVNRACQGRKFIVGGVDSPSVTETLRIAEALVQAGAELLRIRIPRLTSNVRGYFEQVIPRAPAPVLVIHQMAPGKFLGNAASIGADAEVMGDIVSSENVFGYIISDNLRFEARVRRFIPREKQFWGSNGSLLLPSAAIGTVGGCLMLGNVAPRECLDIIQLSLDGELTKAQAIHARIVEADWQILSRGAAGVKAALELQGFRMGAPRAPSHPCDAAEIAQIRAAMQSAGFIE